MKLIPLFLLTSMLSFAAPPGGGPPPPTPPPPPGTPIDGQILLLAILAISTGIYFISKKYKTEIK